MSSASPAAMERIMKIWDCKIGECDATDVPKGGDTPMREAVALAYRRLTGQNPRFMFTGWDGELTEIERAIVENRDLNPTCTSVEQLQNELKTAHAEIDQLRANIARVREERDALRDELKRHEAESEEG